MKIGIIVDKYHLELKTLNLLKYLKPKVDVSIYLEEEYLLDSNNLTFNEDIFFVKGKGDKLIALVKMIENETSIPVINSFKGIWTAIHRFMNCTLLKKAGIPVPEFALNPEDIPPPFNNYITKNIIDQKTYAFNPNIEKINGQLHVTDQRALKEKSLYDDYFFYQKFIKSKWEYKIYNIGSELFFYRQLPVLVNPNKMESREKIKEIPELREMVIKANNAVDLKISSIDFLKTKDGKYYLTDINSSPNFDYIKDGAKIVGDYLIKQAKE